MYCISPTVGLHDRKKLQYIQYSLQNTYSITIYLVLHVQQEKLLGLNHQWQLSSHHHRHRQIR